MSFLTSSPSQTPPLPSTTSSFTVISNNNSCETHENQEKEKVENMECKLQDRTEFLNTEQTGSKNVHSQKCTKEAFASPSSNVSCGTENLQSSSVSQFTSSHMLYNAHFGSAPVAVYNKSSSSNNNNNVNNNNNSSSGSSSTNNNSFTVITTNNLNSNCVSTNTTLSSVNTIVSSDISPFSTFSSPIISPTTAKFVARFGQSASDNAQQELHESIRVPNDLVNMNQCCNINTTTNINITNSNLSSINNSPSDNGNSSDNICNSAHTYEENEKEEMSAEQNMAMLYSPLGLNNKKYKYNINIDANEERNKLPYSNLGICASSNTGEKVTNLQSHFGNGLCSNYAGISNTSDNNSSNSSSNNINNKNGNYYRSSSKSYFSVNDQNNHIHSSDNDRGELSTNPLINIHSCNSNHLPRSVSSYSQGSNDDLQVGERPRIVSSTPSSPRFATRFATDDFIAPSHHHHNNNNNINNNNNNNNSVSCSHYDSNMAANGIMSNDVNLNTQNMILINADTSPSSSSPFLYINAIPNPISSSSSLAGTETTTTTMTTMNNNYIYTSNNPPTMLESTCQFVRSPSTHSFTSDSNGNNIVNITNNTNNTNITTNNDSNNNSFVLTRSESASREKVCHEPIIEVYDPDFRDILKIGISRIFHRPHPSFGVSRLVLCRNFSIDNPNGCTKRDLCKFVHADTRNATRNSIHVNYAWRSLEECTYTRLPAGEELVVLAPNERPPSELIASERILLTRGSVNWKEHSSPLSHCAHYYFNRMCNRGERCNFIHTVYVDPSVQGSFKRAPAPTAVAPILVKPALPSTNTPPTVVIPNNLPSAAAAAANTAVIVTPQGLPMQSHTLTVPFTSSSCVHAASPQSVMLLNASQCTSFGPVAVPVTLTSPSHGIASSASSLSNFAAANTPCSVQNLQAPSLQHPSMQTSPLLCSSMTHSPVQPAPLPLPLPPLQSLSTFYVAPMSSTPSSSRSPVSTSELTPSHSPLMMVMNPVHSNNLSITSMPQPTWGVNAQTNQPSNAIQQFTLQTQQTNYLHGANNDLSRIPNVAVPQNKQIAELTSQAHVWENCKIEELANDNESQKTLKECYTKFNNGCVDSNNLNAVQGNSVNSNTNENQISINIIECNSSNSNKNNVDKDRAENGIKFNNFEVDNNNREYNDVNQLDKIASLLSAGNDEIEWLTPISQHFETASSMGQIDWSFYGDLDDEPFVPASDEIYDIIDDALRNNDVYVNTGESDSDTDNK